MYVCPRSFDVEIDQKRPHSEPHLSNPIVLTYLKDLTSTICLLSRLFDVCSASKSGRRRLFFIEILACTFSPGLLTYKSTRSDHIPTPRIKLNRRNLFEGSFINHLSTESALRSLQGVQFKKESFIFHRNFSMCVCPRSFDV